MASDGKVLRKEKARIVDILGKVRAPMTPEMVEDRIAAFVARVKALGFTRVLEGTLADLKANTRSRSTKKVVLQALSSVAKADATIHPNEQRVLSEFTRSLRCD